jgi:Rrf2 family protein
MRLAQNYGNGELLTVLNISERLGISKIYLEQVFALLKRGNIVTSAKGAQGGYVLARHPKSVTVFDILSAIELTLFERNDTTVPETAPEIEKAVSLAVFDKLDAVVAKALREITLEELVLEAEQNKTDGGLMFYI